MYNQLSVLEHLAKGTRANPIALNTCQPWTNSVLYNMTLEASRTTTAEHRHETAMFT